MFVMKRNQVILTALVLMIAVAGYYRYLAGEISSLDVSPVARLEDL